MNLLETRLCLLLILLLGFVIGFFISKTSK